MHTILRSRKRLAVENMGWIAVAAIVIASGVWPRHVWSQTGSSAAFTLERTTAHCGFDGETCWVHARAGVIPAQQLVSESQPGSESQLGSESQHPWVVMTMQKLLLSGSDVFFPLNETRTSNLGQTWTAPEEISNFRRQTFEADRAERPTGAAAGREYLRDGDETTVCDFVPMWHAASQRLLGVGQSVWYRDNRVLPVRPRGIAYAVYQPQQAHWAPWRTVSLPAEPKFQSAGSGSAQRVDLPGGDILLPIYFKVPTDKQYSVTVCRCRFDGQTIEYMEHGSELTVPIDRGLYEPSMVYFQGRYFLTMRNDQHGYVSVSRDGLHFDPPKQWTFDDGVELGNYNTQQHWVAHHQSLFLVYTRRGADNDHVFRHRAPLFIAEVDPDRLTVLRETEQIVVPERGARLGNFGVVDVSPEETWITVTEWMQPEGVEKYGSDNCVFVAKLKWHAPNRRIDSPGHVRPDSDRPAWEKIAGYFQPPRELEQQFGDYRSPLEFSDGTLVRSPEDWQLRRGELLKQWENRLGRWPPLITNPNLEILASERRENFTQHRVRFQWTPAEKTTGYLLVPDAEPPLPAVVTVYYEPETAIGLGNPHRDFALQLARRGFVTLSIGTTEATQAKTYALYYPSIDDARVEPLSMLGYAAANAWHVLASRPEVDAQRIGIVGHSFGGKWAMFASCLFDKFACAAWSDPGIVFDESRPSVNYWEPWYLGYHPKPWRARGLITFENPAKGVYPKLVAEKRDLHELHALMAPRPFLVSGGSEDPVRRWQALNHTVEVNRILGFTQRVAMTNRPEHSPNADSNEIIYAFFEHFLGAGRN